MIKSDTHQTINNNNIINNFIMCFISFVLFYLASSTCSVTQVSTSEFGNVLYITGANDCRSSDFGDYSASTAYFPSSETTIDNSDLEKFTTMIFEGTIQTLGSGASGPQRIIFCSNVNYINRLSPFHIINPVRIDYYGTNQPTYSYGDLSDYDNVVIHVTSNYGSSSFLGLSVTRDLTTAPHIDAPGGGGGGGSGGSNTTTIVIVVIVIIALAALIGVGLFCYCKNKNNKISVNCQLSQSFALESFDTQQQNNTNYYYQPPMQPQMPQQITQQQQIPQQQQITQQQQPQTPSFDQINKNNNEIRKKEKEEYENVAENG